MSLCVVSLTLWALWVLCLPTPSSALSKERFLADIAFDNLETLLAKRAALTDGIQAIGVEQDSTKRDQDDLREEPDGLGDKKDCILTSGEEGDPPQGEWMRRMEQLLTETAKNVQDMKAQMTHPTDCQGVYDKGYTWSGVHVISPDGKHSMKVYCEQELDGGGWTVFQTRKDGSLDFYRNWDSYKAGFGDLNGEFWLGNDNLHRLTKDRNQMLKIEMKYRAETAYADYSSFWIEDKSEKYKLNVSGFSGADPPGDSLSRHSGKKFSTKDQDNDNGALNCAEYSQGAWWYKWRYAACHDSNLNGLWGTTQNGRGINWGSWKGRKNSLTWTRMMVRTRPI